MGVTITRETTDLFKTNYDKLIKDVKIDLVVWNFSFLMGKDVYIVGIDDGWSVVHKLALFADDILLFMKAIFLEYPDLCHIYMNMETFQAIK